MGCRPLSYFCCGFPLRPDGRTANGALIRARFPAHALSARGGPRPLLRVGCSLRSHRPTVRAATAQRCRPTGGFFLGYRRPAGSVGCRCAPRACSAQGGAGGHSPLSAGKPIRATAPYYFAVAPIGTPAWLVLGIGQGCNAPACSCRSRVWDGLPLRSRPSHTLSLSEHAFRSAGLRRQAFLRAGGWGWRVPRLSASQALSVFSVWDGLPLRSRPSHTLSPTIACDALGRGMAPFRRHPLSLADGHPPPPPAFSP